MAFNMGDDDDIITDINLTPLIDIMLVLLIIFMVTSSVATDEGLDIKMPEASTKAKTLEQESIQLYATKTGEILLQKKKIKIKDLQKVLSETIKAKNNGFIVFKGDKSTPLELILKVMDISNKSGATRFAIATTKN
jgi:biopolymer transport protein ExbD